MFSFLRKYSSSPPSTDSINKNQDFTSQDEVLHSVNPEKGEKGICSQMANLFTKYQISCGSPDFLKGSPEEIYKASLQERRHQEELFAKGEDGLHSAFVDCKTPYFSSNNQLKVSDLNEESLPKLVSDTRPHYLVTYPIKNTDQFHQVAFGKTKKGTCYSFSANFPPKEHSCDSFNDIVEEMHKLGDEDSYVTVAVAHGKK
ncbi:hypothetical protein [Legionella micdadei]|uniref:hypothetical protein n=1 Tax=Legionella micdadei TaxID=451 RepID=UPI0009EF71A1|nr:hypothetical protein [Legionella micdadei]ARH00886.1 hypothetical protein B6V88_10935 [Legionella micdadei]